jgi:hypothetical protein
VVGEVAGDDDLGFEKPTWSMSMAPDMMMCFVENVQIGNEVL